MGEPPQPEPWLRGNLKEIAAVPRAVLHALLLADEDLTRWCADLTAEEMNVRPCGIASVAFHLKHIGRSIDRLLTYAEARQLNDRQMADLDTETDANAAPENIFIELRGMLDDAAHRVLALAGTDLEASRKVGRRGLPTTVGGLLVHIAEHTQRHVGQAITIAKIVRGWPSA
jgi:uncharacterized damage-inducible protein DinB